jgi:hypothetical protein
MSNSNFTIRNAIPEDAAILAAAEREIAKTPGRLASRPDELKDEKFKEKIIALSNNDSGIYLVVEQDGFIFGRAHLELISWPLPAGLRRVDRLANSAGVR